MGGQRAKAASDGKPGHLQHCLQKLWRFWLGNLDPRHSHTKPLKNINQIDPRQERWEHRGTLDQAGQARRSDPERSRPLCREAAGCASFDVSQAKCLPKLSWTQEGGQDAASDIVRVERLPAHGLMGGHGIHDGVHQLIREVR